MSNTTKSKFQADFPLDSEDDHFSEDSYGEEVFPVGLGQKRKKRTKEDDIYGVFAESDEEGLEKGQGWNEGR